MIILLIFLIETFFTAWLNAKFIIDSKGTNQYWHKVQLYQQIMIYISFFLTVFFLQGEYKILIIDIISWAFMYMLVYNTILNLLRKLKWSHLGRYDIVSFPITIVLFIIGLLIKILYSFNIL